MPETTRETHSTWRSLIDAVSTIGDVMATPRGPSPDRAVRLARQRSERR